MAALYITVSAAQAHDVCSTAKAAGSWGARSTITVIEPTGPVPAANVSRFEADVAGNITGTLFGNTGGEFATWTFTGTWATNSDCTGTTSLKFYESGVLVQTATFSTVFVQNSREFFAVGKSAALSNGTPLALVASVDGKRSTSNDEER